MIKLYDCVLCLDLALLGSYMHATFAAVKIYIKLSIMWCELDCLEIGLKKIHVLGIGEYG